MALFPVVLHDGQALPDDNIYYLIARNGVFLKKSMGLVESLTPVDKISILQPIKPYAAMNITPIPEELFAKIVNLFKTVYDLYHSECIVIFHYNEKKGKWKLEIPAQSVSKGSANYNGAVSYKGYSRIGTIHSHGSMGAFHSGTDDNDEANFDGIHITLGNVNAKGFTISASLVFNGMRVKIDGSEYIKGLTEIKRAYTTWGADSYEMLNGELYPFPAAWMQRIKGHPVRTRTAGGVWIKKWKKNKIVSYFEKDSEPVRSVPRHHTNHYVSSARNFPSAAQRAINPPYGHTMGFNTRGMWEDDSIEEDDSILLTNNVPKKDPCKNCILKEEKEIFDAHSKEKPKNDIADDDIWVILMGMDEDELNDLGYRSMTFDEIQRHQRGEDIDGEEEEKEPSYFTIEGDKDDEPDHRIPGTCIKN